MVNVVYINWPNLESFVLLIQVEEVGWEWTLVEHLLCATSQSEELDMHRLR